MPDDPAAWEPPPLFSLTLVRPPPHVATVLKMDLAVTLSGRCGVSCSEEIQTVTPSLLSGQVLSGSTGQSASRRETSEESVAQTDASLGSRRDEL
jgi:hypothetical protein